MHAKKIATVAHRLKEYPYNIVSVVEKIFLNEKVLIFALVAEQLVYIKHRKNTQYFNKSKVESKETPYFAVKFGMIAYGFICAYEIVDEDFVRQLKSLYIESDMILKNKKG